MRKICVVNEIAGINSRLTSLMKKSLHERHLLLHILELSALLQEGVTYALFFVVLRAALYRVSTLLGSWFTINFFLKMLFFKIVSVRYIFKKVS